jgi:SecD/SecF fusion protein
MKTSVFFIAIIFAAFSFAGCKTSGNYDYKITLAPEIISSVITIDEMNRAAEIITKRLSNSHGILQENMKLDVTANRISLTVSEADTSQISALKSIITGYQRLEFWETFENMEIMEYLSKANNLLRESQAVTDNNAASRDEFITQNPLFGILKPRVTAQGEPLPSCMIGLASENDTAVVNRYLQMPEIKELLPRELKLIWSINPHKYDPTGTLFELHALRVTTQDGKAPLDGSVIISASPVSGPSKSDLRIGLTMNEEGSRKWARITRENINRCIAVVLNGYVRSYPRVQAEISGGKTEISGDFTAEEANDLTNIFKSGELPFKLIIVEDQLVKKE